MGASLLALAKSIYYDYSYNSAIDEITRSTKSDLKLKTTEFYNLDATFLPNS